MFCKCFWHVIKTPVVDTSTHDSVFFLMMYLYQLHVYLITRSIDQLVISSYAFAIKISFKINIL